MPLPTTGILDNYNLRYNFGTATLEMNIGEEDWVAIPIGATELGLAHNKIFIGNSSDAATAVTPSGAWTIADTGVATLATVNSNVGSFTAANITVNAKGLITAAANGASAGSPNIVQGSIIDQVDTTSNTPHATGLTVTITPSTTNAPIMLMATGSLGFTGASTEYALATIYKDGANLPQSSNHLTVFFSNSATAMTVPCSMTWLDTDAKTSGVPITYEVRIFNSDGSTGVRWGQSGPQSSIVAQEVH